MKYLLFVLLLVSVLITSGCVQVRQEKGSCGSEALAVTYLEHAYLWGNDGFMTKRYDITVYTLGFPSVKTDISKYEFDTYKQTYCSAPTNQPASTMPLKTTITTIRTPTQTQNSKPKITDGYWCQYKTMNWLGVDKKVNECYQFFSDGNYASGYLPESPMVVSRNCDGKLTKDVSSCGYWKWTINSQGQYEILQHTFTLNGNQLSDPSSGIYTWYSNVN